jgi:antitoxin HicB
LVYVNNVTKGKLLESEVLVQQSVVEIWPAGSSLNEFLQEEGVLEETRAIAIKEVVAWQIEQAMLKGNITKVEMAKRMRNSRAALNRLLGPANDAVTLLTL